MNGYLRTACFQWQLIDGPSPFVALDSSGDAALSSGLLDMIFISSVSFSDDSYNIGQFIIRHRRGNSMTWYLQLVMMKVEDLWLVCQPFSSSSLQSQWELWMNHFNDLINWHYEKDPPLIGPGSLHLDSYNLLWIFPNDRQNCPKSFHLQVSETATRIWEKNIH